MGWLYNQLLEVWVQIRDYIAEYDRQLQQRAEEKARRNAELYAKYNPKELKRRIMRFFCKLNRQLKTEASKKAKIHKYRQLIRMSHRPIPAYPVLDASPWPFFIGFALFTITFSSVGYFHFYNLGAPTLVCGVIVLIFSCYNWWRDLIHESVLFHTEKVRANIRLGMVLFIISETMFFFSFFWAFFHSSLIPAIEIGGVWPPFGLQKVVINHYGIPLLNTIILIVSGATITWSHYSLEAKKYGEAFIALALTICLACTFLFWQAYEYVNAGFGLSDGIYGSVFYILTGFHGLHVFVGTVMLIVALGRLWCGHFINTVYVGFECAIWYWHFVDVIWILLFVLLYIWGNG